MKREPLVLTVPVDRKAGFMQRQREQTSSLPNEEFRRAGKKRIPDPLNHVQAGRIRKRVRN
jgi:hypothetical protein